MTNILILAGTTTHSSSVPAPLTLLLVVLAVGYVLWSRTQGRPLKARRLIVLPAFLVVLGLTDLTRSSAPHLTPKDLAFLLLGLAVSALLGAARGATIKIYAQQGALWQRYRRSTVGLWIALIVAKLALLALASSAGASAGGGTNSLLLSLGVSLLAEAAIVAPRAMSTGLPFATAARTTDSPRTERNRARRGPIHRLLADAASPPNRAVDVQRHAVSPPQATQNAPGHDDDQSRLTHWTQNEPASRGSRTDNYRSDRRRSHRGPIHRLLAAATPPTVQ